MDRVSLADDGERLTQRGDQIRVFGGNIHIPENVTQRGSVVCIGGDIRIDGEVDGDVVSILGEIYVTGRIDGTVTSVMSEVEMDGASVSRETVNVLGPLTMSDTTLDRELINVLGRLQADPGTRIRGEVHNILEMGAWSPTVWWLIFWLRLLHKVMLFVLLVLVVALVPDRIRLMGDEAPVRFVSAFFVGLLGYLGLLVLLGLLTVTVVGIPLAMMVFYVLKWMGIAAIFYAIGRRIGRSFGREMSILGAVLLTFALVMIVTLAPTPLGWAGLFLGAILRMLFFLLVEAPAVGLVILTLAGGRSSGGGLEAQVAPAPRQPPLPPGPSPEPVADAPPAPPAGPSSDGPPPDRREDAAPRDREG
jgi:hypothetical protein